MKTEVKLQGASTTESVNHKAERDLTAVARYGSRPHGVHGLLWLLALFRRFATTNATSSENSTYLLVIPRSRPEKVQAPSEYTLLVAITDFPFADYY